MIPLETLLAVVRRVRDGLGEHLALRSTSRRDRMGGDLELVARRLVLDALADRADAVTVVVGPDRAPAALGFGAPSCRVFVDLEGLENLPRGLGPATLSLAVLSTEGEVSMEAVDAAVVGRLDVDHVWWSTSAGGPHSCEGPVRCAPTRELDDAFVSAEWTGLPLPSSPRTMRSLGCSAAALCLVADGRLDAHLGELGDPVALLAALTIARRAGAYLTLETSRSAGRPDRIVASASLALARQLVTEAPEPAEWSVLPAASGER